MKGRGLACRRGVEAEAEAGQSPRQTFFPYYGAGGILLAIAPALWLLLRMQYELGSSMNLEPEPGYVGHSVPLGLYSFNSAFLCCWVLALRLWRWSDLNLNPGLR